MSWSGRKAWPAPVTDRRGAAPAQVGVQAMTYPETGTLYSRASYADHGLIRWGGTDGPRYGIPDRQLLDGNTRSTPAVREYGGGRSKTICLSLIMIS
ncbi:MAG: hypothetical protein AABZ55_13095 [Bdellovibrionota bacterium]